MEKKELVKIVHNLNKKVHENAREYYHSRPLIESHTSIILPNRAKHSFKLYYDIKDLLVIGALTQSSVLMTGGTDRGKTTLARLVMNGLFGKEYEGWHKIDINTDFSIDILVDHDPGVIKEGKKLSEGFYSVQKQLLLPGLIADELNRSHAKIITKLMHVFDGDFNLPDGKREKVGYKYGNDKRYQYLITAINEGEEYAGTFDIDKAMRRRTVIEIPMDVFTPTPFDRNALLDSESRIKLENMENHVEEVLRVYGGLENIELHPTAKLFLAYLQSFDYCKNSMTKEKSSVTSKGGSVYQICTQPIHESNIACEFLRSFENDLCPYVREITPGVTKKMIEVAKGAALLRAVKFAEVLHSFLDSRYSVALNFEIMNPKIFEKSLKEYVQKDFHGRDLVRASFDKYTRELEVRVEDLESIVGFVGYSKIGISTPWIAKHYQGNRFEAINVFVKQAKEKFEEAIARPELIDDLGMIDGKLSKNKIEQLKEYCDKENPWFWKVVQPYIDRRERPDFNLNDLSYFYR